MQRPVFLLLLVLACGTMAAMRAVDVSQVRVSPCVDCFFAASHLLECIHVRVSVFPSRS
jgi:hypothetical protein